MTRRFYAIEYTEPAGFDGMPRSYKVVRFNKYKDMKTFVAAGAFSWLMRRYRHQLKYSHPLVREAHRKGLLFDHGGTQR